MPDINARRIQLASFSFLIAAAAFAFGLAVAHYRIWPYQWIQLSAQAGESLVRFGEFVPEGRRVEPPADAARVPFTVNEADALDDGLFVFLGSDDATGHYAAWLYDASGELFHTWPIDYRAIDPKGPPNDTDMPHAFAVLEDGSAIVSFDGGDVMARVDACGKPVWVKEGIFHHALTRADDGSFWIWRAAGSHYAQFHYITNFDPASGETLSEIGLVEDIIGQLGPYTSVFGVRHDFPSRHISEDPESRAAIDFFHPNDVDVLSEALAPAFPMFAAGDLLLSFREIDLVAVLDPATKRLKWWSHGAWIKQHDPDFIVDGTISVYSNNSSRGRSEILKIDPATHKISNELYHGNTEFYSASMGKHQYLPNGNILIAVPDEGRALLVSPNGNELMEFNNLSSKSGMYNEHVENAAWVPPDFFDGMPHCTRPD